MHPTRGSWDGLPVPLSRDELVPRGGMRHELQRWLAEGMVNELLPEVCARAE
jgi:hypothetical protein